MKLTMTAAEEFLALPEDSLIQVSVHSVDVREVPGRDGKDGWTSLSFRFTIIDMPTALEPKYGSLIGGTIFGSVSAKLTTHPDNKLRKWTEALLGLGELDEGFELETEMFIGRKARAQVGNYTKTGSTQVQHKVIGLLPLETASVGGGGGSSYNYDEPPF
jgi:hypothetical protein